MRAPQYPLFISTHWIPQLPLPAQALQVPSMHPYIPMISRTPGASPPSARPGLAVMLRQAAAACRNTPKDLTAAAATAVAVAAWAMAPAARARQARSGGGHLGRAQ